MEPCEEVFQGTGRSLRPDIALLIILAYKEPGTSRSKKGTIVQRGYHDNGKAIRRTLEDGTYRDRVEARSRPRLADVRAAAESIPH